MRRTLMPGLLLVLASVLVVLISSTLKLELEPVALLGMALAPCSLWIPDQDRTGPLAGFAAGLAIALDRISTAGRAAPSTPAAGRSSSAGPSSPAGRRAGEGPARALVPASRCRRRGRSVRAHLHLRAAGGRRQLAARRADGTGPRRGGRLPRHVRARPAAPAATSPRAATETRETDENPLDDFMTREGSLMLHPPATARRPSSPCRWWSPA